MRMIIDLRNKMVLVEAFILLFLILISFSTNSTPGQAYGTALDKRIGAIISLRRRPRPSSAEGETADS